ncbi:Pex24p-domain-containing protein [Annulohypoxylon truncatum]|uniref:Pex24p-domain-containing protein n=1 Tax=Annulohypoxylon truncatum TaxID=327061 RepID=UPI0020073A3A|nr:Pex24p-domain-containing protein [Annulohypoxylon truncatum]KAI1204324.1 Pex24p-domain-containing protein [Annulohypoxylon truncatum]
MSTPKSAPRGDVDGYGFATPSDLPPTYAPPTYASFSPANLSTAASAAKRRSTILVHQKSPLLLATPPQITRALAYSHPFLLPLNKLVGLLTWTTGDPWESFLLLVVFWATVQYGDVVVQFAGPIAVVMGIIGGMYGRRYSPLSSSGWAEHPSMAGGKDKKPSGASAIGGANGQHQRNASEITSTRHQKTLDEIVDTVKVFTTRCNILLEPLLEMTDFLSTQRTATSATTRPALTTLFVRILAITPVWVALTLPPLRIITTKRVVLVFGTLLLTWHSRVCRVSRTLLWRSATMRRLARLVTGLQFDEPAKSKLDGANGIQTNIAIGSKTKQHNETAKVSSSALTAALKRSGRSGTKDSGVRFTFIIYENQRRWLGLGWTNSLFAYERAAWTDEHNNPVPPKDEFELPEVEDGHARWRWVEESKWRVDGAPDLDEADYDTDAGKNGWVFYDNKWQNGRRGNDGWGRWTRRRKWYRDAELVEVTDNASSPPPPELPARPRPAPTLSSEKVDVSTFSTSNPEISTSLEPDKNGSSKEEDDAVSVLSTSSKSARLRMSGPPLRRRTTGGTHRSRRTSEAASLRSNDDEGRLTPALELEIQGHGKDQGQWGIGDEAQMGLE